MPRLCSPLGEGLFDRLRSGGTSDAFAVAARVLPRVLAAKDYERVAGAGYPSGVTPSRGFVVASPLCWYEGLHMEIRVVEISGFEEGCGSNPFVEVDVGPAAFICHAS